MVSVNRHTGGLENAKATQQNGWIVNRHTGGLEMPRNWQVPKPIVNRHTGGLENVSVTRG